MKGTGKFGWCLPYGGAHEACQKEFVHYGVVVTCACECHQAKQIQKPSSKAKEE